MSECRCAEVLSDGRHVLFCPARSGVSERMSAEADGLHGMCAGPCERRDLRAHLADVEARLAAAWDEGATKASPYGGGYLRSVLIENPYRAALHLDPSEPTGEKP